MGDAYDESLVSKVNSLNIVGRKLFAHVHKNHIIQSYFVRGNLKIDGEELEELKENTQNLK